MDGELIVSLLTRKCDCLEQILAITADLRIDSLEQGVEAYITMSERNAEIFGQVQGIDKKLASIGYKSPSGLHDSAFRAKAERLEGEAKAGIEKILTQDSENKHLAEQIMVDIRTKIKEVNDGRSLNTVYYGAGREYSSFDKRK